jgi:hypothetical protein
VATAAPAHAIPGLEAVSGTSVINSLTPKSRTAVCPAGKVVIGSGGTISVGGGQVILDELFPSGADRVTTTAYEDDNGTSANWLVRALATCAPAPAGYERVPAAVSASNSTSPKSATATCPSGKYLIGTGARIEGGLGQVVLDDVTPSTSLQSIRVTAYEDEDGTAANWTVRAYAICASPPPGLHLVVAHGLPGSSKSQGVTAACAPGFQVHGLGGEITGGNGQVSMDDLPRHVSLNSVTVTGVEDETGTAANWSVRAYAICAQ